MSCFFACFGAKVDNKILDFQPPFVATTTAKEHEKCGVAKVVVSRHQLSDLFASQELEDVSYHEKSAQFQSVDTHNCNDKVIFLDKLPDQTCTPPAKARESTRGLDSQEESPASCISDQPSESKNSVTTSVKSEKENLYDTSKESLASQTVTPSGNNRSYTQKTKNGPASSPKNLPAKGSVSSGLKPVVHNKAGGSGKSPRDRPVLRNVTAQWNGNGIPNSTNKYREDQIVSWDGTPFEERLEKALSEANSIAQRKHVSGAYDAFDEEIDTAASQLHSLLHSESVV